MASAIRAAVLIGSLAAALSFPAAGRDTTNLSQTLSPELQEWVRGLRGADNISCCDEADGIDPVWETHGNGYRVQFRGEWLPVEERAVLKVHNRLGVARAWIGFTVDFRPYVRCFLPGPTI